MNIGGGSVAFILCNQERVHWKQSFEIGAKRLMAQFHQQDPIPDTQIKALQIYIKTTLKQPFEASRLYPVTELIGSAGSFETFRDLILHKGRPVESPEFAGYHFEMADYLQITDMLEKSNHQERLSRNEIIPLRVDKVVVASLLTRFILQTLKIERISISDYALKEGLVEMLSSC